MSLTIPKTPKAANKTKRRTSDSQHKDDGNNSISDWVPQTSDLCSMRYKQPMPNDQKHASFRVQRPNIVMNDEAEGNKRKFRLI